MTHYKVPLLNLPGRHSLFPFYVNFACSVGMLFLSSLLFLKDLHIRYSCMLEISSGSHKKKNNNNPFTRSGCNVKLYKFKNQSGFRSSTARWFNSYFFQLSTCRNHILTNIHVIKGSFPFTLRIPSRLSSTSTTTYSPQWLRSGLALPYSPSCLL